jgi:AAA domain
MSYSFRPAVREQTKLLLGIAGPSGSGKTFSALTLATGLAGPGGKIGFIDTEAGRALHYADKFKFDHCELEPPFKPARFREVIQAAEAAKYDVIIIDSFSHEWSGEGGCLDWADAEVARGQKSPSNWIVPKAAHKNLVSRLLQARAHLIFCLRAEEKIAIEKVMKDGREKTVVVPIGWKAICEKNFMYEMTVSFVMTPDAPGVGRPEKLQDQHRHIFPDGQRIGVEAGRMLADWASGGAAVSTRMPDPFLAASEAAERGTEALRAWWTGEGRPHQKALAARQQELKDIAAAADGPPKEEAQTEGRQSDRAADDDWALLDASAWLKLVMDIGADIGGSASRRDLEVKMAAPKFAGPYAAMKRHAPKSAEAVDELVRKRREGLS